MAHHKRRRPKHQRAGCLFCKPHKDERGAKSGDRERPSVKRKLQAEEPAELRSPNGASGDP
jgi:hypothetical protein